MGIELATPHDIKELDRLIHLCYRHPKSLKGWTSEAEMFEGRRTTPGRLSAEMSNPKVKFIKCTDDADEIVGCISTLHDEDKMIIGLICVHPYMQSKGIGKRLMKAAEDLGRRTPLCNKLIIEVISQRKELVGWFERQGYEFNGEAIPFPERFELGIPKIPLELIMEMEKSI